MLTLIQPGCGASRTIALTWCGPILLTFVFGSMVMGQEPDAAPSAKMIAKPGLFQQLTEPPCSYCVNQDRKRMILADDPVVAWIRGAHNGGAAPLRHFLSAPRVLNDTYGLFFYDPDGGYVSVFEKDYGYEFYGWRKGILIVRGRDGTLWSGLSGTAIDGPQKGRRLQRVPSLTTDWQHWLLLHPESTAYDLFDGQKYPVVDLPTDISDEARATMGAPDSRLAIEAPVLGIEGAHESLAISLVDAGQRACWLDQLEGRDVAVFWYGATRTAVAFYSELEGRKLTFYADQISPDTAPFKDRETGSRWTLAGRAVDGPLRGKELTWAPSLQARWYAWSGEYPQTRMHQASDRDTRIE